MFIKFVAICISSLLFLTPTTVDTVYNIDATYEWTDSSFGFVTLFQFYQLYSDRATVLETSVF